MTIDCTGPWYSNSLRLSSRDCVVVSNPSDEPPTNASTSMATGKDGASERTISPRPNPVPAMDARRQGSSRPPRPAVNSPAVTAPTAEEAESRP